MALYYYRKQEPSSQETTRPATKPTRRFPWTSALLMTSGIFLIGWVVWPIVAFELFMVPTYISLTRPIPDEVVVQALDNQFAQILGSTTIDYTKASNWFPKSPPKEVKETKVSTYTLTIPKLGIKEAQVIVGGDDLSKSLIHYGGTTLPGDYGKAVIFGHSVLPIFFNPKNYLTIFSTLPALSQKEKDEIFVTVDNVTYKYVVDEMEVVSPDDISVLEQKYDWPRLCLVTCVPPGTYFKRLNICARLEKLS